MTAGSSHYEGLEKINVKFALTFCERPPNGLFECTNVQSLACPREELR